MQVMTQIDKNIVLVTVIGRVIMELVMKTSYLTILILEAHLLTSSLPSIVILHRMSPDVSFCPHLDLVVMETA